MDDMSMSKSIVPAVQFYFSSYSLGLTATLVPRRVAMLATVQP